MSQEVNEATKKLIGLLGGERGYANFFPYYLVERGTSGNIEPVSFNNLTCAEIYFGLDFQHNLSGGNKIKLSKIFKDHGVNGFILCVREMDPEIYKNKESCLDQILMGMERFNWIKE